MPIQLLVATRRDASLERLRRRRQDFARYLLGVTVCSLGVALAIDSGLGAAPYDTVLTGLTSLTAIPFWLSAWLFTGVWIVVIKVLGGAISAKQIVHGALFGPIIEFCLWALPSPGSLVIAILYGLTGVLAIAFGIHMFLSAQLLSGVLDTLFETVSTRFALGPRQVRLAFDLTSLAAGVALGGAIGPLTVVVAMSVAPLLGVLSTFDGRRVTVKSWRGIRLTD
jgi:uncharacterized membrane protein YczE